MAKIKYTSLIDCAVSTEGSNGVMTNYFYYNVLVVYEDGSRELVTGKKNEIAFLLPFMRTPMDDLMDMKATVINLRQDIDNIVEQKMKYVIDSIFPIPDILNKNEVEANELLKEAGFTPVFEIEYPESTPKNGYVQSYRRSSEDFKRVELQIIHRVPEVRGMKIEEALGKLKEAGFTVTITHITVSGTDNGVVINSIRLDESKLLVNLEVATSIPETTGMPVEKATKLLQAEGYRINVKEESSETNTGKVLRWEDAGGGKIRLIIGKLEKVTAKHVDVKWTNMQDSTADEYEAVAWYDYNLQKMNINVMYKSNAKSKHQIIETRVKESSWKIPYTNIGAIEPNSTGTMNILVPSRDSIQDLPEKLSFTIDTQYGLTKKKDSINLQFEFEW